MTTVPCPQCRRPVAEWDGNTFIVKEKGRIVRFIGEGSTTCPHMILRGRTAAGRLLYDRCPGIVPLRAPVSV